MLLRFVSPSGTLDNFVWGLASNQLCRWLCSCRGMNNAKNAVDACPDTTTKQRRSL
jgi:hypothetical protein